MYFNIKIYNIEEEKNMNKVQMSEGIDSHLNRFVVIERQLFIRWRKFKYQDEISYHNYNNGEIVQRGSDMK